MAVQSGARDTNRIHGQREANGGNARGRTRLRPVSYEPIHAIGLVEEVLEGAMLQCVQSCFSDVG